MKKKNKLLFLFLFTAVILLAAAFFYSRNLYIREADRVFYNIIGNVKKTCPQMKPSELIHFLEPVEDAGMERVGVYEASDLMSFSSQNRKSFVIFFSALTASCAAAGIVFYVLNKNKNKEYERLMRELSDISHGNYDISFSNGEDNFSRLQNEIYKNTLKLKEESLRADRAGSKLKKSLEDVSHQIKAPITAMRLLLENLSDPEIGEDSKKELTEDLKTELDAVTKLVLTLLQISLLDSETVNFKRETIHAESLISEAASVLKPIFDARKISLETNIEGISFTGDRTWEKELYINLLKNAAEHSTGGKVVVGGKSSLSYAEIFVENEALPLSEEVRKKIFDRFYKFDGDDSNFGIGLNLCKMVAEADNAKIRVSSKDTESPGKALVRFTVRYYFRETT